MSTVGMHAFDQALKTYFSPERIRIDHIGYGSWVAELVPRAMPLDFSVPIAATMAIAGFAWLVQRRNLLAAEQKESTAWLDAVVAWFVQLMQAFFPPKPKALEP